MLLKTLLLSVVLALPGSSQTPDGYDTLNTRSNKIIVIPKYDTVSQLQQANKKADSILLDLQKIACKLGINDTIK